MRHFNAVIRDKFLSPSSIEFSLKARQISRQLISIRAFRFFDRRSTILIDSPESPSLMNSINNYWCQSTSTKKARVAAIKKKKTTQFKENLGYQNCWLGSGNRDLVSLSRSPEWIGHGKNTKKYLERIQICKTKILIILIIQIIIIIIITKNNFFKGERGSRTRNFSLNYSVVERNEKIFIFPQIKTGFFFSFLRKTFTSCNGTTIWLQNINRMRQVNFQQKKKNIKLWFGKLHECLRSKVEKSF